MSDVDPLTPPPDDEVEALILDALQAIEVRREAKRRDAVKQATGRKGPDIGTLGEVLARPDDDKPWRIERLLDADARMTIVSQHKTGKTVTMANLAWSLTTGHPFLGRFGVTKLAGNVGFLNYEVTARRCAHWLDSVGVPHDRLTLFTLRGRRNPLLDDDGCAELVKRLKAGECEFLIVDPFGKAFTGTNQNDATEVGAWTSRLDEVAEQAGCREVVMAVHAGWDGERGRGSTALGDWPDAIATMTKDETGARYFRAEGRDVDIEEDRLSFDPTTRRLTLSGAGNRVRVRQDTKLDALIDAIVEITVAAPGLTMDEMRKALREAGHTFQRNDVSAASQIAYERGRVKIELGARGAKRHLPVGPEPTSRTDPYQPVPGTSPDPYRPVYIDGTGQSTSGSVGESRSVGTGGSEPPPPEANPASFDAAPAQSLNGHRVAPPAGLNAEQLAMLDRLTKPTATP